MYHNKGSLWFLVVAIALVVAGLGAAKLWWAWLHPGGPMEVSNSETLRNVGFLMGGALAFVFAGWRAWIAGRQADTAQEQANIAQRTLLNDQYQRGADMLSSEGLAVRLAGIYALQSLAERQPDDYHVQVMRLLCAFVKSPPKDDALDKPEVIGGEKMPPLIREDAQAALSAIGQRNSMHAHLEDKVGFRVELHGANLRFANVRGFRLNHANLIWADLTHADLEDAIVADADLTHADLSSSKMNGADFSGAICTRARMFGATARGANFVGAKLEGTIWSHSDLTDAHLRCAKFRGADLRGVIFAGANISGTIFGSGGRRDEDYSEGRLGISARQAYTSVTQEQLDSATSTEDCPPSIEPGTTDYSSGSELVWKGSRPTPTEPPEPQ